MYPIEQVPTLTLSQLESMASTPLEVALVGLLLDYDGERAEAVEEAKDVKAQLSRVVEGNTELEEKLEAAILGEKYAFEAAEQLYETYSRNDRK